MTDLPTHVRPGDLIRAEDINALIDLVVSLDARVTKLEGSNPPTGAPQIFSILPAVPRVGDEMRIIGANFEWSIGRTDVHFDNAQALCRGSSSDNLLILPVPDIAGLPETGRQVQLKVANGVGTTRKTITVLPLVNLPDGDIQLSYGGPAPGTPTPLPGKQFVMACQLISRSDVALTLTVAATVSVPDWQPSVQILDANMQPVAGGQIQLASAATVPVNIGVNIPAGTAAGFGFTLLVTAQGQGMSASVGPKQFTVGTGAPTPNPNINFTIDKATGTGVNLTGNLVKVPANGLATISLGAVFAKVGTYSVSVPANANWPMTTSLPTSGQYVIQSGDVDPDGKFRKFFNLKVTAPATASGPITLTITGAEQGNSLTKTTELQLQAT